MAQSGGNQHRAGHVLEQMVDADARQIEGEQKEAAKAGREGAGSLPFYQVRSKEKCHADRKKKRNPKQVPGDCE